MNNSLWSSGAASGPSPAAVAEVARRLVRMAADVDALRLQLGTVAYLDWSSPAAAAFREELNERNMALAAAGRAIDAAAAEVCSYGLYLNSQAEAGNATHPVTSPGGGSGPGAGGGKGEWWRAVNQEWR